MQPLVHIAITVLMIYVLLSKFDLTDDQRKALVIGNWVNVVTWLMLYYYMIMGKNKLITYFANDTVKRTVLSATHLLGTFGPVFLLTYGENLLERIVDRAPFDQIEDANMVRNMVACAISMLPQLLLGVSYAMKYGNKVYTIAWKVVTLAIVGAIGFAAYRIYTAFT